MILVEVNEVVALWNITCGFHVFKTLPTVWEPDSLNLEW